MKHPDLSTNPPITSGRAEIIAKLDQLCRDNGNRNILLVHAIAQHINLSASEFECCSHIYDHGPSTAGELAKACGITTGGMTGMIDRLERAGFVKRKTDPNDRRRVLVIPTPNKKTSQKISKLYEPLSKAFARLVQNYSEEELAIIINFMEGVNEIIGKTISALPHPSKE